MSLEKPPPRSLHTPHLQEDPPLRCSLCGHRDCANVGPVVRNNTLLRFIDLDVAASSFSPVPPIIRCRVRHESFKTGRWWTDGPAHLQVFQLNQFFGVTMYLCGHRMHTSWGNVSNTLLLISPGLRYTHVGQSGIQCPRLFTSDLKCLFFSQYEITIWQVSDSLLSFLLFFPPSEHLPEMGDDRPFVCTAPGCGQVLFACLWFCLHLKISVTTFHFC